MRKTKHEKIMERINALPSEKRESAIREYKNHEYFNGNTRKHEVLISDTANYQMATASAGNWIGVREHAKTATQRARKII